MNIFPPILGRVLVAIALVATGFVFILFGYAVASAGESYGVGLIIVGVVPLLLLPAYLFRGARLGAEILNDCLIVHHYFHDTAFCLDRPLRVYRSVDAIVIEAPARRLVIDDCYFSDLVVRDALFDALLSRSSTL